MVEVIVIEVWLLKVSISQNIHTNRERTRGRVRSKNIEGKNRQKNSFTIEFQVILHRNCTPKMHRLCVLPPEAAQRATENLGKNAEMREKTYRNARARSFKLLLISQLQLVNRECGNKPPWAPHQAHPVQFTVKTFLIKTQMHLF